MSDNTGRNSRRHFYKVTYSPLKTRAEDDNGAGDALGRAALVRALRLTPDEVAALRNRVDGGEGSSALDVVADLVGAVSAVRSVEAASRLADVSADDLLKVVSLVRDIREEGLTHLTRGIADLDRAFVQAVAAQAAGRALPQPAAPLAVAGAVSADAYPQPARGVFDEIREMVAETLHDPVYGPAHAGAAAVMQPAFSSPQAQRVSDPIRVAPSRTTAQASLQSGAVTQAAVSSLAATNLSSSIAARMPSMMAWAAVAEPAKVEALIDAARAQLPAPLSAGPLDIRTVLLETTKTQLIVDLVEDALTRRPLEPVGLLHLERLEMTPLDVERGELLYSLPLAPREKVTLAHKEWSIREEEFEEYIQDYLENFSEKGVTETEEISSSTQTQTRHANALSMSQAPTASNGVTITTPVDAQNGSTSSVDNADSREESKDQSRSITSKASARTIKDHKVSFTVTTVAGTEDFTARLLTNEHKDRSMLIDYFRRMRKWKTDLFRYGVRMTYDVVLPDPGRELRNRNVELQDIDAQLATPFVFGVNPSDINIGNWETYADSYGVALRPPPADRNVEVARPVDYDPPQDVVIGNTHHTRQKLESVDIPIGSEDYEWQSLSALVVVSTWHVSLPRWLTVLGGGIVQSFSADPDGWINANVPFDPGNLPRGAVTIVFQSQYVSNGLIKLTGTITPTEAAMEAWRLGVWKSLHDSAYADYLRNQDRLRERRAILVREMAKNDPLSLRRMEREQVMRAVLEWLFPGFDDASSVLTKGQKPGSLDADTWRAVMEYGEYIKFVQSAVDWDNVLVLLFPYFWDTPWNQNLKLFLDHPDPIHREFLRAGAARVVLAIKPGFEEELVSLLDRGQLGALPNGDRFTKIVKDVSEANAAYLQTGPGDPEQGQADDPRLHGKLIGSWFDYTPTPAMDIQVTTEPVTAL